MFLIRASYRSHINLNVLHIILHSKLSSAVQATTPMSTSAVTLINFLMMLLLAALCIRNSFEKVPIKKDSKRRKPSHWSSLLSELRKSERLDGASCLEVPRLKSVLGAKGNCTNLWPNIAVDTILTLVNGHSQDQQHPHLWHFSCQKRNQGVTILEVTLVCQVSGTAMAGQGGSRSVLCHCLLKMEGCSNIQQQLAERRYSRAKLFLLPMFLLHTALWEESAA